MNTKILLGAILSAFLLTIPSTVLSEEEATHKEKKEKTPISFKDSLDGAFDVSDFLITKNGFLPVPAIVTEPSLGGFGAALAPIFIKQNAPVERNGKVYPLPPDITAVVGGYTLNGTWAAGGARTGIIRKWGLKYAAALAYADVNMDYFFSFKDIKDAEFDFNIKTIPVFLSADKQLKDPRFTVGLQYLFMHNTISLRNDQTFSQPAAEEFIDKFNDFLTEKISGNVAHLGTKIAFDNRDNVFTPNKGFRTYLTAAWSNPVVGSDYKYGQFEGAAYYFIPWASNWVTGTRLDIQQVAGDAPFYLLPFVDMRGVPMARYLGRSTALAEVEQRWDFVPRWSLVGFAGAGKGFDKYSEFSDADWAWGYGGGFRYLIARKLKLRMGLDFANGPEGFAYYIVFGTSWMRQ